VPVTPIARKPLAAEPRGLDFGELRGGADQGF